MRPINTKSNRVFRGGSWRRNARYCRAGRRNGGAPGGRGLYLGFRLSVRYVKGKKKGRKNEEGNGGRK